ncbi:hypothetical protein RN001_011779 [Aquatica leii]|uniref:Uncharacterized protein n=1 Tax=Aquatica leii TaxID=1421715 RepID=A0AAN7SCZ8_9COLE|nr:hypothetical protein RN001_011779 [Aquatica leii]
MIHFKVKVGIQKEPNEQGIGPFGLEKRNSRGETLVNYVQKNKLHLMNTYLKKPKQRRWTWLSPNGDVKNEIDYVICNDKHIIVDTTEVTNGLLLAAEQIRSNKKEKRQKLSDKAKNLIETRKQLLKDRNTNKIKITEINNQKKIREDMKKYRNMKIKETLKKKKILKELRSTMK